MKKTQIFTLLTYPLVLGLAWILYNGVKANIDEAENIKKTEITVVEKLKMIREAQKQYLAANAKYAKTWDELKAYIKDGKVFLVEKHEKIMQRAASESYKGDSILVTYDTIGVENALDHIFPKDKFPNFDYTKINQHPVFPDKEFTIFADTVRKSNVIVHVTEVVDPFPIDKTRKESNDNRKRRFLRFGSKEETSLTGNWED